MSTKQKVRRTLVVIVFVLAAAGVVAFVAMVIPNEYRFGRWRELPTLDHRLLPHLSAIFAGAFGAFFGSLSAFYLGRIQQRRDRHEKRHAALVAAQYALISQWNIIEGIRRQHLEPFRDYKDRFLKLKLLWFPMSPTFVPFGDLTFVLQTNQANILHEIHLAEQNYRACVEAVQVKNKELQKFYDNPRISHEIRDFETGVGVSKADEKELLFLKQATDALYISVDRTLPRLADAIRKLAKLITSIFPGEQALLMVNLDKEAISDKIDK